jgi:protein PhnA
MLDLLIRRSDNQCELCGDHESLTPHALDESNAVLVCGNCGPQLEGEIGEINHWYCLQGSIWSEVPAVAALSWRMLNRLKAESWAAEAIEGIDLDATVMALARGSDDSQEESEVVVDANGIQLQDGDSVTLIKDLDVKGANFTAKRGTMVKNIRLGFDPTHVEGRINKQSIMLKTCFLKRA